MAGHRGAHILHALAEAPMYFVGNPPMFACFLVVVTHGRNCRLIDWAACFELMKAGFIQGFWEQLQ